MKELSIEEKAKDYDGLIERLKDLKFAYRFSPLSDTIEEKFPELKENGDERIRKELLNAFQESEDSLYMVLTPHRRESFIAWLEKQGETFTKKELDDAYLKGISDAKKELEKQGGQFTCEGTFVNVDDVREEFMQEVYRVLNADYTNDRANQIIDAFDNLPTVTIEMQSEKNTIVVIPKFRVGDVIRPKGSMAEYTIESISGECYHGKGWGLHIICDDDYELVEQKPITRNDAPTINGELNDYCCKVFNALHKEDGGVLSFPRLQHLAMDIYKWCNERPSMIQWKGDNLKEVIAFTGKAPQFNKWFKTFDEYEQYVYNHNKIFKLFNEDGNHYEVPVGAWIVRTPDGCNVASRAVFKQKPAEWSEEDKCIYDSIIHDMLGDLALTPKQKNWLKSLKDRVGCEVNCTTTKEWSDEDDVMLNSFLHKVEVCDLLTNKENVWIVKKLKSLKDKVDKFDDGYKVGFSAAKHNQWKPSGLQMEALDDFIYSKYPNTEKHGAAVKSLYQDLKKLREE